MGGGRVSDNPSTADNCTHLHKTHYLKTLPDFFQEIKSGDKTFEIRLNDRNYQVGDRLCLQGYDPETNTYSGAYLTLRVTYVLSDNRYLQEGYVCMGIRR